jgi:Coenzyme F390 synthetase
MGVNDSITVKALSILRAYGSFRNTYNFLKNSQYWGPDQQEKYQFEKLNDLLEHSYENVPYYRKVFNERDLVPSDIYDIKSLSMLPLLTKDIIKNNLKDLKATNFSETNLNM